LSIGDRGKAMAGIVHFRIEALRPAILARAIGARAGDAGRRDERHFASWAFPVK